MIARLSGTLIDKTLDGVLVDVGGVGYQVSVSLNTLTALPAVGHKAELLTHLHVREDAMQLFGFATKDERRAFELCIAVSGIGPKLAIGLLSGLDAAGRKEVAERAQRQATNSDESAVSVEQKRLISEVTPAGYRDRAQKLRELSKAARRRR